MEAKRADSQGFGIDQLNTLQTFEVPWVGWLVGWLKNSVGDGFLLLEKVKKVGGYFVGWWKKHEKTR